MSGKFVVLSDAEMQDIRSEIAEAKYGSDLFYALIFGTWKRVFAHTDRSFWDRIAGNGWDANFYSVPNKQYTTIQSWALQQAEGIGLSDLDIGHMFAEFYTYGPNNIRKQYASQAF